MSRLSPGRQKSVLEQYGQQLEEFISDEYPNVIDVINQVQQADPTVKGIYLTWLVKQLVNDRFRIGEDEGVVKEDLRQFEKYKQKLPNKDINSYDLYSLRKALDELLEVPQELSHTEGNIVYDGPLGTLIYPMTKEEAIACGRGTRWCTAAEQNNMFDYYFKKGPIITWIEKGGKYKGKYQFHFEVLQFMDSSDKPITQDTYLHFMQNPILRRVFKEGEDRIIKNSTLYVLTEYISRFQKKRRPELEERIMQDPIAAANYAAKILESRWLEAEPIILNDPDAAVQYAAHVIKERWQIVEDLILERRNPIAAEYYARNVIHDRWQEAEPIIMRNLYAIIDYARFVIKGRWKEAEPRILRKEHRINEYTRLVIKGRWKEAEMQFLLNNQIDMLREYYKYLGRHREQPIHYTEQEKNHILQHLAPTITSNPDDMKFIYEILGI